MFQMLQDLKHEVLIFIVLPLLQFSSSQNTDVLFDSECAESGEMCGEVTECCVDLKCDVNEPVARCVDAREVNSQEDAFEGSGQASAEQEHSTTVQSFTQNAKHNSSISKFKYLKDKIMNFFKGDNEVVTTTEKFILPEKVLSTDLFSYRQTFRQTTLSPFERLRNLFFVNGVPSSSSSETNELV